MLKCIDLWIRKTTFGRNFPYLTFRIHHGLNILTFDLTEISAQLSMKFLRKTFRNEQIWIHIRWGGGGTSEKNKMFYNLLDVCHALFHLYLFKFNYFEQIFYKYVWINIRLASRKEKVEEDEGVVEKEPIAPKIKWKEKKRKTKK